MVMYVQLLLSFLLPLAVGIVAGTPRRRQKRGYFQRVHRHTTEGVMHQDEEARGCNGNGWVLSSCDVYEKCRYHYDGQTHPERRVSEARMEEQKEIYRQRCREQRIEDPAEAHEKALAEKKDREEEETGELPF